MSQVTRIGIVGGGQLAMMMTEAAIGLGLEVTVLDPSDNCPAAQAGAKQIVAAMDDAKGLKQLAEVSDVITIDVEHVDTEALQQIADKGVSVLPLPSTVRMIQDKYQQKLFLRQAGIAVADFIKISSYEDAVEALKQFNDKMLIKTRRNAYDGRGNMVIEDQSQLEGAMSTFSGQNLYAEAFVPFDKELAIMIARDINGNISTYPVVETIQSRNICEYVLAPARVSETAQVRALDLALQVAEHLEGPGIYGIEMFLRVDGEVVVNEIAPRVHNSGHYTIEACATSQFEQHIRAIAGLPLGSSKLIVKTAAMANILGERNGAVLTETIDKASLNPHTYVHMYGKSPTKLDRKMGHITVVAETVDDAYKIAQQAKAIIKV